MSKKLRLDFWKKSFWQEPHILGSLFHAGADVLLPAKVQKAMGLFEDIVDNGKLDGSNKKGSKTYWILRSVFTVTFFFFVSFLIVKQLLTLDEALDLIKSILLPIVGVGMAIHGGMYRIKAPEQGTRKIFGHGDSKNYFETRIKNEDGTIKVCRDYFDDIIQASAHVDYPFGSDNQKRSTKFLLIEP